MIDLDRLEKLAIQARQGVTGEWTWDDGTLIELDHEDPVGIQVTQAAGSPVAPHIAAADPATVLAMVVELRAAREVIEELRTNRVMHDFEDCTPEQPAPHPNSAWYQCDACRLVAAYDRAVPDRDTTSSGDQPHRSTDLGPT